MGFNNYAMEKLKNLEIEWPTYIKLNTDLAKAGIVTLPNVIRHWFKHAMNENRIYNKQKKYVVYYI